MSMEFTGKEMILMLSSDVNIKAANSKYGSTTKNNLEKQPNKCRNQYRFVGLNSDKPITMLMRIIVII